MHIAHQTVTSPRHAPWRLIVLTAVAIILQGCGDDPATPVYSDEIQAIAPAHDTFDVPVRPVFDWSRPAGATHFDLRLGPTLDTLSPVVEGVTDPPVSLPDQLAPNREYFWQVVARAGDREWQSEIWRFVTVNPEYVTPTEPHVTLVNLFKAWKARDEAMIDSLLAPEYRYIPSGFERVDEFDREAELASMSALFQDPQAVTFTVSERREDWVAAPSDDPRFPAEEGYWELGIAFLTFGVLWQYENGDQTLFRLPTPVEVLACSQIPECSPNTGAVAFVRPAWTTSQGLPVYKLVRVESYYHPYAPQLREESIDEPVTIVSRPDDDVLIVRTSWGFLKEMGRRETERQPGSRWLRHQGRVVEPWGR